MINWYEIHCFIKANNRETEYILLIEVNNGKETVSQRKSIKEKLNKNAFRATAKRI